MPNITNLDLRFEITPEQLQEKDLNLPEQITDTVEFGEDVPFFYEAGVYKLRFDDLKIRGAHWLEKRREISQPSVKRKMLGLFGLATTDSKRIYAVSYDNNSEYLGKGRRSIDNITEELTSRQLNSDDIAPTERLISQAFGAIVQRLTHIQDEVQRLVH